MHAWQAGTLLQFRQGDKQKRHGSNFEKTHGLRQLYIPFFFAVLNSSTQYISHNFLKTKHTAYIA